MRHVAGERKLAGDCASFSSLNRRGGAARSPMRLFRLGCGEMRLTLAFLTNVRFAPEAVFPKPFIPRIEPPQRSASETRRCAVQGHYGTRKWCGHRDLASVQRSSG